ncbi:hypothetical protein [Salsuginibacillus kocurii]|uniref:hypothetical protein n=1 Tax=Salsuginibacillus kocurii TaxID=427078 RepID=UPI00036103C6|nr:hypothetical protein [Salsuginibacillus kocurii]
MQLEYATLQLENGQNLYITTYRLAINFYSYYIMDNMVADVYVNARSGEVGNPLRAVPAEGS